MKRFNFTPLAASLVLGCLGVITPVSATTYEATQANAVSEQNQMQLIRQRWASYFLGDENRPTTQNMKNQIADVNAEAKALLANLTIEESGLWSDSPLSTKTMEDQQKLGVNLYATYNRIFTLARAYKLKGGELEGNPSLLNAITESLAFLNETYYQVGSPEYGNWWHWELGIARSVQNTLVILYDDLPYEIISNYIDATRYFVPNPTHLSEGYGAPYSSAPLAFESTGGNRTDNAQVVLVRGLLENNANEIVRAIESLSSVIPYVETGDGFYKDGSFIQHKDLPYSGTYGQVMVEGLGMLLGAVANTKYQANDPNLQKIYPLILDTFAPLLINGRMADMVNGRAISRKSGQNDRVGESIISAMLLYIDGAPEPYKHQLSAFVQSQLAAKGGLEATRIMSNYQIAESLMMTRNVKDVPTVSHKQFAEMDRVIHHRPDWSFGIAMHSDRVGNYESINGENLKGWHTADGMTYLYNSQNHYNSGYWVAVNPYKHAGTTVLLADLEDATGQLSAQRDGRNGAMSWTGGASLDHYGVAGMDFVNASRALSAKKSWFMFDDEVVALGSAIDNSSDYTAITTIENRIVDSNNAAKIENGVLSITYQADTNPIQYVMLDAQPIDVQQKCRSADWSDIGTDKGSVEACFVEATITHTSENDSYAYAIIPNQQPVSSVPVKVVANTESVHAVEHIDLGIFAANFFDSAKAGEIEASNISIMTQEKNDLVTISVSNPTRSWFDSDFTIDGQFEIAQDEQNRVSIDDNQVSVELSDLNGSSYTFQLKRIK